MFASRIHRVSRHDCTMLRKLHTVARTHARRRALPAPSTGACRWLSLSHHNRYSDEYIQQVLEDTKVVAMVGASTNWNRPSYFAMKYMQAKGYRVIPVNPVSAGETILGEVV